MNNLKYNRVIRSYIQHIHSKASIVFPLLCPVREAEWLEDWKENCEMIYSKSGLAEKGCVFRTKPKGSPETIWMITEHNPEKGIVEFYRVTTGLVATHLKICVEDKGDETSLVHITYTLTPTCNEGVVFVERNFRLAEFQDDMAWWEQSINYFLKTGEMLKKQALDMN